MITLTRVRPEKQARPDVIGDAEFNQLLASAQKIESEFYRLRLLALLALLRLVGKRREEIAMVALTDIETELRAGQVRITFNLEKKRRRKKGPDGQTIPAPAGPRPRAPKTFALSDPLIRYVLEWVGYLKHLGAESGSPILYLFPRTSRPLGAKLVIYGSAHIGGRQIYNLIAEAGPMLWPHLFRETAGSDEARADESLMGVYKIMRRLDLVSEDAAMRYIRRYAGHRITSPVKLEVVSGDTKEGGV